MNMAITFKKGNLSMSGNVSYKSLLSTLKDFIDDVILCPKCELPELTIELEKKKVVGRCNSCSRVNKYITLNEKILKGIVKSLNKEPDKKKKLKTRELDRL